MASELIQFSLPGPARLGLNTEQQSAQSQEGFATTCDNVLFDEAGKVTCRKGYTELAGPATTTNDLANIYWWRKSATAQHLVTMTDSAGTTSLVEMTSTSTSFDTFTARGALTTSEPDDWSMHNCNGHLIMVADGKAPYYWTGTGSAAAFAAAGGTQANPQSGIALSAFGRLFIVDSDKKTIWGSELAPDPSSGINWDDWYIDTRGAAAGTAKEGWSFGRDYITALQSIGDILVVFGTSQILLYTDINGDPYLVDSVVGVGCTDQKTAVNVGDDILFRSNTGIHSLRRTLQKETPVLADASAFIRSDIANNIDKGRAIAVHSEIDAFYWISDGSESYMLDLRDEYPRGSGARRASRWTLAPKSATYDSDNNEIYFTSGKYLYRYGGYLDGEDSYKMTVRTSWLTMGTQRKKIVKKMAARVFGGSGYLPTLLLSYDWTDDEKRLTASAISKSESGFDWNEGEWSVAEWTGQSEQPSSTVVQARGSGSFVRMGIEFDVSGTLVGVRELRLLSKLGKLADV